MKRDAPQLSDRWSDGDVDAWTTHSSPASDVQNWAHSFVCLCDWWRLRFRISTSNNDIGMIEWAGVPSYASSGIQCARSERTCLPTHVTHAHNTAAISDPIMVIGQRGGLSSQVYRHHNRNYMLSGYSMDRSSLHSSLIVNDNATNHLHDHHLQCIAHATVCWPLLNCS